MTPTGLLEALAAHGACLVCREGRLRYRGPAALLTPRLRAAVAAHRPALLALLDSPQSGQRLSAFAASGCVIPLFAPALGAVVYLAADNADLAAVPPDAVVFWPDELAALHAAALPFLALLHEAKRCFDPHGRTAPDSPAPPAQKTLPFDA